MCLVAQAGADISFHAFETDRFREFGDWIAPAVERVSPPKDPTVLHFVGGRRSSGWRNCP